MLYWGDIDAAGLQFVSDLRGYGIAVTTVMMNRETLDLFADLSVDGAGPQRRTLPNLDEDEQNLYTHLVEHADTGPRNTARTGAHPVDSRLPTPAG